MKILAKNAFDSKEDLKNEDFVWDKEAKAWVKDFSSEEEYNTFFERWNNPTYYGRHNVRYHARVKFEVAEDKVGEGINDLYDLAAYINRSEDYPLDVEAICEARGWEVLDNEEVATDHRSLVRIAENGVVEVVAYKG